MARKPKIERFNDVIRSKFEIYNSLFLTLPFGKIHNTSIFLALFNDLCVKSYQEKKSPFEIVEKFFAQYFPKFNSKERFDILFQFIQYIEREIVLFDSIEDAGFSYVNNMHGQGTLRYIKEEAKRTQKKFKLKEYLNKIKIRIVLTAHPTQFYPGSVLGIITDLGKAIKKDNTQEIRLLLAQLGKTPFIKKEKPTPYDEAINLIWYLENVLYHSASTVYNYVQKNIFEGDNLDNSIFDFGFWPGGDRDGNPFVTPNITLKTARTLKQTVLGKYQQDLQYLKRRLTFKGVKEEVLKVEKMLDEMIAFPQNEQEKESALILETLLKIRQQVKDNQEGLYLDLIDDFINKIKLFGFYFATLDIRQDSRIHNDVFKEILSHKNIDKYIENFPKNYFKLDEEKRVEALLKMKGKVPFSIFKEGITKDTIKTIGVIKQIQKENGEKGCNRYIISNCQSLENILQLYALLKICNWKELNIDIIPLFETITDFKIAPKVMEKLYSLKLYRNHLEKRGGKQTIMLGFSDGTKDGGYFMANWSIYKAKEQLSEVAQKFGIKVAFFDGRGGPPARGGGNTHLFYASLGEKIQNDDIQLTIQGQTVSSNFGTFDSCQFNLEQLLSAAVVNCVFNKDKNNLKANDKATMEKLAEIGLDVYKEFKSHPKFVPYLEKMTTLKYYGKANVGSRPSKRKVSKEFSFSDLRAIPFVISWSLSKQNVPGFYGVGTALQYFVEKGKFKEVESLYKNSLFFRTLIANSMMSLKKSFFNLTTYMKDDPEFGEFWNLIYKEYKQTKKILLQLTGFKDLMEDQPAGKASIEMREKIVLPLLTIQQFALNKIQKANSNAIVLDEKEKDIYEKLIIRSLFGNINASRNSA